MTIGIGLGLFEFPFSGPRGFWKWVDLCEAGGIDSLWQSDRLVTREPFLEAMSTMAALAGRTRRIKFGMNVIAVALREPLLVAKQCATVDMLSEGRLLPAFGVGSPHSADWKATGLSGDGRGRRTDEALDIIAALWRGESVTRDGEFFSFRDARISPLPAQRNLPLWIGGSSKAAIRRTARIGTGWVGGRETPADAARVVQGVKRACAELGRRVPDDHYGASFVFRFGHLDEPVVKGHLAALARRFPDRNPRDSLAVGGVEDIAARVHEYLAAGVTKFVLRPVGSDDEDILTQTRRLIEELLPVVESLNAEAAKQP